MSMRISSALLCAALALSGCMNGGFQGLLSRVKLSEGAVGEGSVTLRNSLAVQLPTGWCADPQASRPRDGFALIAGCGRIAGEAVETPPAVALLQMGEAGSAPEGVSEEEALAFLRSPQGLALLADRGEAADISDLRTRSHQDGLILRYRDAGVESGTQVWRALLTRDGALISVTVRALPERSLNNLDGEGLLIQLLTRVAKR